MERIAKFIASSGTCSRRDAEKMILAGKVKLNGTAVASPAVNVSPKDKVEVDGKRVKAQSAVKLYAYNKPAGFVVSHSDPQGRMTIFQTLDDQNLKSIGRLDLNSEGIILLTNSGELQRKLEKGNYSRIYRVRIKGVMPKEDIVKLGKGLVIDDIRYQPITAEIESSTGNNSWVLLTLTEGKNREIRKIMNYLQHPVSKLVRISYAGVELGELERGKMREIELAEIAFD